MAELASHDLGRVERILALRAFPGWHDLRAHELATLASIAEPCFARAGTVLVAADAPVDTMWMIVRGRLQVSRHGKVLGTYDDTEAVGGLAAFSGVHDGYEVVAVEDSSLLAMNVTAAEEIFEDRFRILEHVLRELARQMVKLRKRLPRAGYPAEAPVGVACPARSLDLIERIFYLRNNLSMDGSSVDSVAVLAKTAEEIRLAPGERLWAVGDPADGMVAILCGRVRGRTPEGHEFELGAGDLAGSLGSAAQIPRWYDCEVAEGLVGLFLPRDVTMDVWEDHPELPLRLLRAFSRSVLQLQERFAT